ncbi:hypothetical protein [Streptomyces sp. NPDC056707]|uniref:hypothetical protein n=1 Tax=Streptomyces sp. NPDC056707 TaxID=3345919 RepID=UPI0036A51D59
MDDAAPRSSFCSTQPGGRRGPRISRSVGGGGSRVVGTSSYETPGTGFTWSGAFIHTTYQAGSTPPSGVFCYAGVDAGHRRFFAGQSRRPRPRQNRIGNAAARRDARALSRIRHSSAWLW